MFVSIKKEILKNYKFLWKSYRKDKDKKKSIFKSVKTVKKNRIFELHLTKI